MVHNVKHTKIGLWDLYEEQVAHVKSSIWPSYSLNFHSLPYLWRMFNDILAIQHCRLLLFALVFLELLLAVVPAIQLSFQGRLLNIVQTAVDHRTVDTNDLLLVVAGSFLASTASRLIHLLKNRITAPLQRRIKAYYSIHIFAALARLDVPTFDDPAVLRQIEQATPHDPNSTIAFSAVSAFITASTRAIRLISQLSVLVSVLRHQPDGPLLATFGFISAVVHWRKQKRSLVMGGGGVWYATTKDDDYIKSEGYKRVVNDPAHRKELVASGIAPFLLAQYCDALSRIADRTGDFWDLMHAETQNREPFHSGLFFQELLRSLPEIVFTLRAVKQPTSIPVSLTSLHLISSTTQSFTTNAMYAVQTAGSFSARLEEVKHLYQIINIPNHVQVHPADDTVSEELQGTPFPENDKTLSEGISVEFSNVSFIYPGSDAYALRNVSFKILRGQLCVIVGNNGSGKSTILKLIARLYDPIEGNIYIDGIDIKTLRLADLRRALSVLFQDYTYFPLSVRENIGLGDPANANDLSKIERAAQLGGADGFISRLPEQYNTYLDRPVRDHYARLPQGSTADFANVRKAAGVATAEGGGAAGNRGLSGGQMQRIALSRMFMRSVVSDHTVGLLLFDEPSASLDPTAEHDLFERLRTLRGNKTMVFSSHRFGNLTRHADLILYMNDSVVVEEGTHAQLVKQDGEYARIWTLQAQAFI